MNIIEILVLSIVVFVVGYIIFTRLYYNRLIKKNTIVFNNEYYNEEDDDQFETARNFLDPNPCNRIERTTSKKEKILFTLQCMKNYFQNYDCNLEDIIIEKYTKEYIISQIMILLNFPLNMWNDRENKMLEKLKSIYNLAKKDEKYRITNNLECNGDNKLKF